MFDNLALHAIQRRRLAFADVSVCAIQPLALRQIGVVLGQQWQAGVVRGAQRLRIHDCIEMSDRRPDPAQPVLQLLERFDDGLEARIRLRLDLRHAGALFGNQAGNGRFHLLGRDGVEARQRGFLE